MAAPTQHLDKTSPAARQAGRPIQVGLVLDGVPAAAEVSDALGAAGRFRASAFPEVGALQSSSAAPDAVLIALAQFLQLRESEPMAYLRLSRRARIVVVLESRELLDAAQSLAFADAWLFSDLNAGLAPEVVELGLEGHCLVPEQFLSRVGVDEIRMALVPRLTEPEYRTLRFLGMGLNNRTIGERLDLSEAVVKSIVRSVLSKLHFRNRTEAGVFAARQEAGLDGVRTPGAPAAPGADG